MIRLQTGPYRFISFAMMIQHIRDQQGGPTSPFSELRRMCDEIDRLRIRSRHGHRHGPVEDPGEVKDWRQATWVLSK